jgi:hypothetical protein
MRTVRPRSSVVNITLARPVAAGLLCLLLASCGGGGGGAAAPAADPTGNSASYTVSVTVSNLQPGTSLTLLDDNQDSLTVSANGTVAFATSLANGSLYSVSVATQPTGQTCSVSQGSGTVSGSNVTVAISCAAVFYSVSATVTGLTGSGLVLELNGSQDQTVAADGTVTFPNGVLMGAAYAVTVKSQPKTRREICGVSNGSGTIGQANVTGVAVNCSIVVGFVYQTANTTNQTQSSYQLLSYGISSGTGALVGFGTPLVTNSPSPGGAMVTSPGGGFVILSSESNANTTDGGFSVYAVDSGTGTLTPASTLVTALFRPSSMVMSPQGFLFVLGTGAPGFPSGASGYKSVLATYQFNAAAGTLTAVGTPLTVSAVNLAVRPDGKFLYVLTGDFSSSTPAPASLTAYAINGTTGALTAGPVLTWTTSSSNTTSPGSAGMAIDGLGRFLYLASEQGDTLQAAATVLPYAIDQASGALTAVGTGTPVVSNASVMRADPSGKYLYVLNTLNSSVANDTVLAMAIDQSSGAVSSLGSPLPTGSPPRTIVFSPTGGYVGTDGSSFVDPASTDILPFTVSTDPSTLGQLVPGSQSGLAVQTLALAMVE